MPTLAHLPNSRAEQVEWFHALAHSLSAGNAKVDLTTLTPQVAEFVTRHLPGHVFPLPATEAEFIESVRVLRANETAWNQRLTQAIFEAREQASSGSCHAASALLRAFAGSCPWVLFAEVAAKQAQRFEQGAQS